MIFLFDVDGVCADLMPYLLEHLKYEFGNTVNYADITSHDVLHPGKSILPPDQLRSVHQLMCNDGFAQQLPMIPGCSEAIRILREKNHTIKWLTAPYYWSKTWCYDRVQWLKIFDAKEEDVIFAKDKSLVCGDVFVDDKVSNLIDWQVNWRDRRAFVFPQPWNANCGLNPITWSEIAELD